MVQLVYNEAFDPYHAVFRAVRLNFACAPDEIMPFDMLRILDFYMLFPFRIQGVSLYREDIFWRQISKNYEWAAPYGGMPEDTLVFARMEPFQRAAISSLARLGIINRELWSNEEILFESSKLTKVIISRAIQENSEMKDIMEILCGLRERYPLLGDDGLKRRTKLMEYRYDSV